MNDRDDMRLYFHSTATDFDRIYAGPNVLKRHFNRIFRAGMFDRFRLTFEHCGDLRGKSVLDVGCGSGRYCPEFARRGAKEIVGLDFAPNMLDLARNLAQENGIEDRCSFILADFMGYDFGARRFDISVAHGFFDYIRDPSDFLAKMLDLTTEKLIASFPKKDSIRTPIRKIRYKFKRCPVYFFSKNELQSILNALGYHQCEILNCRSGGYVLVVTLTAGCRRSSSSSRGLIKTPAI